MNQKETTNWKAKFEELIAKLRDMGYDLKIKTDGPVVVVLETEAYRNPLTIARRYRSYKAAYGAWIHTYHSALSYRDYIQKQYEQDAELQALKE